jgi:hypothetical protein
MAAALVSDGCAERMIAGAVEVHDAFVEGVLAPVLGAEPTPRDHDVGGFVLLGTDPSAAWAEVSQTLCAGPGQALRLPSCADESRAAVLSSLDADALDAALAVTGWESVARQGAPPSLEGEAVSAHLICVAAETIHSGRLDEALIVTSGDGAVRATLLRAVGPR